MSSDVTRAAGNLKWLGIATVVLGVLALLAPLLTGITIAVMVGMLLVAAGITRTLYAFQCQSWGKGILTFLLGAVTLLCGVAMVLRPLVALASITLILAIYFVIEGFSEIFHAFDLRPMTGWGWTLFSGLTSLLLGMMIWSGWPLSGAWAIGVLVGIQLLFGGWAMVGVGSAAQAGAEG